MHLKYIEIHGFKSFPDKTRIEFEKGLTAIVGPNGSGKSNISDAVRWVLGEQSSKSLRGNKMEDVVFDGSKKRGAMGYAGVTLCLDNSDGRIPDVGNELLVGRRYYRSGDSEYTINGAAARLRDVREMFMDTGLGRDGYSIIGQGRIDAIVSAKSSERREIFEEASGIAKYRFRKEEASRRLEAAQDNIERLKDLLGELESRVGPLENQSKKAKEFLALSDQKRGLEITLYCDVIRRSREQVREQSARLEIAKSDYEKISSRMVEIENLIEHNSELARGYSAGIDRCNAEINQLAERQGVIDGELAVLQNDLTHHQEEFERFEHELAAFGDAGGEIERETERLRGEIEQNKSKITDTDRLLKGAEDELNDIIKSGESSDRIRLEASAELGELSARLTAVKVESVSQKSGCEANSRRLASVEGLILESAVRRDDLAGRLESANAASLAVAAEISRVENIKNGFELKLKSKNAEMKRLNDSLNSAVFAADECSHRIKALTDLERSMDGFSGSVRRVIQAKNSRELRGIVETVASILSIKPGYETAIEAALGGALQNIVVEDENAAKAAINYLKQTKAGRATFLPVTTIRGSHFDGELSGTEGLASGFVSCDERYKNIVSSLLGRIIVARDIDAAAEAARKNRYRFRVVTLDGQMVNAGGSFTGGFTAKGSGVLSRRAEIEELQARLTQLQEKAARLKQSAAEESAEAAKLSAELTALESDIINKNEEKIRAEALRDGLSAQYESAAAAVAGLENEKAELTADTEARSRELRRLEDEQRALEQRGEALELKTRESSSAEYVSLRARAQERLSELKLRRMELQKDGEALEDALEKLGDRAQGLDERRREAGRLAGLAGELVAAKQREIDAKKAESAAVSADMEYKRAEIADFIEKREKKEWESTRLRAEEKEGINDRERMGRETARLEERRLALEQDFERAVARLWEDYELTPAEAEGMCVPFDKVSDLKKEVGDLRQRIKALGHVNVGAIDELKQVNERLGFIKTNYEDVNSARLELIKLIDGLTGEMQTIFADSFGRINQNFGRVFAELFGGGEARLYLTDESDVLESGIEIDARPPGKVIKNLASLSGGEKALVAIALYFSMLSVNPSPFCVLDEIDTALDDSNVLRFAQYINRITDKTQFLAITHRRGTMENASVLYGVTMQEEGVSKLIKLDIESVDATLIR